MLSILYPLNFLTNSFQKIFNTGSAVLLQNFVVDFFPDSVLTVYGRFDSEVDSTLQSVNVLRLHYQFPAMSNASYRSSRLNKLFAQSGRDDFNRINVTYAWSFNVFIGHRNRAVMDNEQTERWTASLRNCFLTAFPVISLFPTLLCI